MKNWFFFITLSISIGFINEWMKLNVNFQLSCYDLIQNWENFSIEEKQLGMEKMTNLKQAGFYNQPVDWPLIVNLNKRQLSLLKWITPFFFSLLFFLIEYFMVPILFNNLVILRKHVVQYYAMVFTSVMIFYGFFYLLNLTPLLTISRKLWVLLQGPSLFVLLLFYQKILKYVK